MHNININGITHIYLQLYILFSSPASCSQMVMLQLYVCRNLFNLLCSVCSCAISCSTLNAAPPPRAPAYTEGQQRMNVAEYTVGPSALHARQCKKKPEAADYEQSRKSACLYEIFSLLPFVYSHTALEEGNIVHDTAKLNQATQKTLLPPAVTSCV